MFFISTFQNPIEELSNVTEQQLAWFSRCTSKLLYLYCKTVLKFTEGNKQAIRLSHTVIIRQVFEILQSFMLTSGSKTPTHYIQHKLFCFIPKRFQCNYIHHSISVSFCNITDVTINFHSLISLISGNRAVYAACYFQFPYLNIYAVLYLVTEERSSKKCTWQLVWKVVRP